MITVVVPCYNAQGTLDACLAHLHASTGVEFEVVVVDDHSTDRSLDIARRHACRIISLPQRRGPSFAREAGAREANGDLLVFVDSDIHVKPDTLARVARGFEEDRDLVGMNGCLDKSTPHRGLVSRFANLSIIFQHGRYAPQNRSCFTSLFAVRAGFFWSVGGFDKEARTSIVDDVLFRWRLVDQDRLIRMNRDLVVSHDKEMSLGRMWTHRVLVGYYFLAHNRKYASLALRRPREICLHPRNPLNTLLAACLVVASCTGQLVPLALVLVALCLNNAGFLAFAAEEKGVLEAGLYLPLLGLESFGFLAGMGWYGLTRLLPSPEPGRQE